MICTPAEPTRQPSRGAASASAVISGTGCVDSTFTHTRFGARDAIAAMGPASSEAPSCDGTTCRMVGVGEIAVSTDSTCSWTDVASAPR
ncbi:hypothetical protein ASE14_01745 [Agromyces sp. Root81]|nr:hypothetical protein ASE14_01745 [Agromyces sp. Root81]